MLIPSVLLLMGLCAVLPAAETIATPPQALAPPPSAPAATLASSEAATASQPPSLTLEQATQLALQQASAYQQAVIDEQTAALELTQAHAALLPRLRSASSMIYNRPLHAGSSDPAFIAQNASREYQELLGVEGSLDFGLRATISRNRALLAAAHAGTEIARRALIRGTREAYFGLALALARRRSAEEALAAAAELERVTALQEHAGEVPEVDVIRARLQSAQRRDDLEQATLQEVTAAAGLRVLVGVPATQAVEVAGLTQQPSVADIERFPADAATSRPEILQANAALTAAHADIGVARAGRLPALTYSVDEGFDTPSLMREVIRQHEGYLAMATLNIPIFDWGAGRAKQREAELRAEAARNQLLLAQRDVALQFLTAREGALAAVRRADNARDAVEDARRNAVISLARYRAGEAPIVEVTDALTTLAQLRANYEGALYDFEVARARLQEAAGE
jgi:outer membrane protein TolC